MSKEIAKGKKDKAVGNARERFAKSTGRKSERVKGRLQSAKGSVEIGLGKARKKA